MHPGGKGANPRVGRRVAALAFLVGLVAVLGGISASAKPTVPPSLGQHSSSLDGAAADLAASWEELRSLRSSPDPDTVESAGERLKQAIARAKGVAQTYVDGNVSQVTIGEFEDLKSISESLPNAVGWLAEHTPGNPYSDPTEDQLDLAEEGIKLVKQFAKVRIEEELGIEGVEGLLKKPTFKKVVNKARNQLHKKARNLLRSRLGVLKDLPLTPGLSLRDRIASAGEKFILQRLSTLAVKAGPAGLVIDIVTGGKVTKLVNLAGKKLKRGLEDALRRKGNVKKRANRSVAGLEKLSSQIHSLPPETNIRDLQKILRRASSELGRTRYLERDLARRRKDDLAARLAGAIGTLSAQVKEYEVVQRSLNWREQMRILLQGLIEAERVVDELLRAGGGGSGGGGNGGDGDSRVVTYTVPVFSGPADDEGTPGGEVTVTELVFEFHEDPDYVLIDTTASGDRAFRAPNFQLVSSSDEVLFGHSANCCPESGVSDPDGYHTAWDVEDKVPAAFIDDQENYERLMDGAIVRVRLLGLMCREPGTTPDEFNRPECLPTEKDGEPDRVEVDDVEGLSPSVSPVTTRE